MISAPAPATRWPIGCHRPLPSLPRPKSRHSAAFKPPSPKDLMLGGVFWPHAMHAFLPTASHASSRVSNGPVVRRARSRGPWSEASRACGSNSMSSFRLAVGICPSCACNVPRNGPTLPCGMPWRLRSAHPARIRLRQPRSSSTLSKICTGGTAIMCPIAGFAWIRPRSYPPPRGARSSIA